jgi:hypothetical protein
MKSFIIKKKTSKISINKYVTPTEMICLTYTIGNNIFAY